MNMYIKMKGILILLTTFCSGLNDVLFDNPSHDDDSSNSDVDISVLSQNVKELLEWKSVIEQKHRDYDTQIAALKQQNEELKTILKDLGRNTTIGENQPRSCADIYKSGQRQSGVYTLLLTHTSDSQVKQQVYCDMETRGGGWVVFQRRQDGSVLFNRTWYEYKHGFGNMQGEFWLGNDFLSLMTSQDGAYRLRIDMTSSTNETRYAEYENFAVGNENTKYILSVGEYSGTAGDGGEGLSGQNQKKFTTYDNDNDELTSGNCATEWGGGGGFWYRRCDYVNPNGAYLTPGVSNDQGIEWEAWLVDKSLKATEMKFRPMNYP